MTFKQFKGLCSDAQFYLIIEDHKKHTIIDFFKVDYTEPDPEKDNIFKSLQYENYKVHRFNTHKNKILLSLVAGK